VFVKLSDHAPIWIGVGGGGFTDAPWEPYSTPGRWAEILSTTTAARSDSEWHGDSLKQSGELVPGIPLGHLDSVPPARGSNAMKKPAVPSGTYS
jgi:hypothetical protein